jgi:hypothetical protein
MKKSNKLPIHRFSQKDRKARRQAIAQYAGTEGVLAAANKFKVSAMTVRKACYEFEVTLPDLPSRRLSVSSYQIIADLINTKDSLAALAEKYNVHRQWVSEIYRQCAEVGITMPARTVGRPAVATGT